MNKSKSKKSALIKPSDNHANSPIIDWPISFVNLLPNKYQQINDIIPGQIYTLPSFFSASVCDDLVRYFEKNSNLGNPNTKNNSDPIPKSNTPSTKGGKNKNNTTSANNSNHNTGKLVFATTQLPPKKDYAARVNDRAQVYDKLTAQKLWKKLKVVLLHESKILNKIEYGDYHSNCSAFESDVVDGKSNYTDQDSDYNHLDSDELQEIQELRNEFQECIGLNDHFRIYRYIPGHYFGQHYDESVKASVIPLETPNTNISSSHDQTTKPLSNFKEGKTVWTMLVYLTGEPQGEVTGGETLFYPNEEDADFMERAAKNKQTVDVPNTAVKIKLDKGTALLHKHGDDCLLHESAIIKSGVKWVLRTDLVY